MPELRPKVPVENLATNVVFDTATGKWSPLRPMLAARDQHGAALGLLIGMSGYGLFC